MAKYLNVKDAAAFLAYSKSSLDKLRCYGGGPEFIRLGRAVRYSVDDLVAWAEAHRAGEAVRHD